VKIAVLGRTRWLLDTGRALMAAGHDIVAVATAKSEPFYGCGPEDFASLASDAGAVDFGVVSLSDVAVRERLRACGAELAVSINWPTIVGADVIGLFPRGVVNAHCGDLPRYRGNACPNWAILNAEQRIGLCAHMMEPNEVDAGAVILRDYFRVSTDTYIGDVYAWLNQRISALLAEAIEGLETGRLVPQPQPADPSLALRCYPRRPEDGRIEWNLDVAQIHRLVRASSRPFEGAFSHLDDGRRVTVWRARPFTHDLPFCAVPGQVMLRAGSDPVIACGRGALRLEKLEIDGLDADAAKRAVGRSVRGRLS
jgi:methionyl-tRNA formyltransferase